MWFAAYHTAAETPWFERLMLELLKGIPPVLALLASNPFPDRPPKYGSRTGRQPCRFSAPERGRGLAAAPSCCRRGYEAATVGHICGPDRDDPPLRRLDAGCVQA